MKLVFQSLKGRCHSDRFLLFLSLNRVLVTFSGWRQRPVGLRVVAYRYHWTQAASLSPEFVAKFQREEPSAAGQPNVGLYPASKSAFGLCVRVKLAFCQLLNAY